MDRATILVVDDEKNILTSLSRMLRLESFGVVLAGSAEIALEKLEHETVDLVLLDVLMPGGMDGLEALKKLRRERPDLPVVMMSGHASVETAMRAVKDGAQDFVEKPLSSEKLLVTIENALKLSSLTRENQSLKATLSQGHRLVGRSPRMKAVTDRIARAAPSMGSVLITGESGTGKELVARAIHDNSRRATGPFVRLNCAAIPGDLIESELFGHEKGAFTGAHAQKKGKFEIAHRGTLFLDEVGDMRLEAQAKLLRVLQEGELERVGGTALLRVDVRIVAATHKDLPAEIAERRFREDLYYRINVVPIEVPPLREHREDVPELVEHFLGALCEQNGRRRMRMEPRALERLVGHQFPGNVRELRNIVERLVILTPGDTIRDDDVALALPGGTPRPTTGYLRGVPLREMLDVAERGLVEAALTDHAGHVTRTAEALGLERSHLYKKMKQLGIRE